MNEAIQKLQARVTAARNAEGEKINQQMNMGAAVQSTPGPPVNRRKALEERRDYYLREAAAATDLLALLDGPDGELIALTLEAFGHYF